MLTQKKHYKVLLVAFLSIVLIFSSFQGLVFSYSNMEIGDFVYQYADNGIDLKISGYTGPGGDVIIPDTIDGKKVTSIWMLAFQNCATLKTLTISNGIESIESGAFSGCSNLTDVKMPDSLKTIGFDVFYDCGNLTSITIPKGVTSILSRAFGKCSKLEEINVDDDNNSFTSYEGVLFNKDMTTLVIFPSGVNIYSYLIPDKVTSIADYAFTSCNNLASVILPNTVKVINTGAFFNCSSLVYVAIPEGVYDLKQYCFSGSKELTLYGVKGSPAERYAKSENISFEEAIKFDDLGSVNWAKNSIDTLAYAGVISGDGNGNYRPNENVTRAEFAKLLTVLFGAYNPDAVSSFTDIDPTKWYASFVASAEVAGLTKGNGDGTYSPNSSITREQIFIFCSRVLENYRGYTMLDSSDVIQNQLANFVDAGEVDDWARINVATCIYYGMVSGSPVSGGIAVKPLNAITRAEVAVVLYRAIQPIAAKPWGLPEETPKATPEPTPTPVPTASPPPIRYATREEMYQKVVELTGMTNSSGQIPFNDANQIDPKYLDAMNIACSNGILKGNGDGTCTPKAIITKAEFSIILCRAIEKQSIKLEVVDAPPACIDISGSWYTDYINKILGWGIMSPDVNGYFHPLDDMTYDEMQAVSLPD